MSRTASRQRRRRRPSRPVRGPRVAGRALGDQLHRRVRACGHRQRRGPTVPATPLAAAGGAAGSTRTSHGWIATPTRPVARSAERIMAPPPSSTSLPPPSSGRASPVSRLPPVRLATNASAGRASSSAGVPSCRSRPSSTTPTRWASAAASVKSCVTISAGIASSASTPGELLADLGARVRVERGERLVEQQHGGIARERAGHRDALALAARQPPGLLARQRARCRGARAARRRGRAPPKPTLARTLRCGNSAYSWNTSPTERRSGGRSIRRAASNQTSSPSAIRPARACAARRPRAARWSCPHPTARRARPSPRRRSARLRTLKARSGTVMSSSSCANGRAACRRAVPRR